jgi:transposase-like protein
MAKWPHRDLDFKRRVVARMRTSKNIAGLARELGIDRSLLYQWKLQLAGRPQPRRADLSQSRESAAEKKLREENRRLKEALGEKALEADFFASALRRIEEQRRKNTASGEIVCTPKYGRGDSGRKAD